VPNVSKLYAYTIDGSIKLAPLHPQKKKQIKIKLWVHPPSQLIIIELGTGYQSLGKTKEG